MKLTKDSYVEGKWECQNCGKTLHLVELIWVKGTDCIRANAFICPVCCGECPRAKWCRIDRITGV